MYEIEYELTKLIKEGMRGEYNPIKDIINNSLNKILRK